MTVSLDEQIVWLEVEMESWPDRQGDDFVVARAILASLRQLQARTTALEECAKAMERLEWDNDPDTLATISNGAQRARQALEER